jgi:hypothetical protein
LSFTSTPPFDVVLYKHPAPRRCPLQAPHPSSLSFTSTSPLVVVLYKHLTPRRCPLQAPHPSSFTLSNTSPLTVTSRKETPHLSDVLVQQVTSYEYHKGVPLNSPKMHKRNTPLSPLLIRSTWTHGLNFKKTPSQIPPSKISSQFSVKPPKFTQTKNPIS